jgi:membrane associated rhomboid family serine protease
MTSNDKEEKKYFIRTLYIPVVLLLLIWIVKGIEIFAGISLGDFGIYPREISGLRGILFAPFIHGDFNHLINNSVPFFLLNVTIFYFYKPVAFRVVFFIWLITGACVWVAGRESYHIGASSLIYGNAAFLFFSGVIRMDIKLLAISLLVVFLYGGMIWWIFPFDQKISWESHLFGGFTGMVLAFIYANKGRKNEEIQWNDEEDDNDDEDDNPYWKLSDEDLDKDRKASLDEKNNVGS